MNTIATPIEIYTESTPNPETLKFVVNRMLIFDQFIEFKNSESALVSPLAASLFSFPFIQSVFLMNNFITLTKTPQTNWNDVTTDIKELIRNFFNEGNQVFENGFKIPETAQIQSSDETEVVSKIKEMLDKYIKPAVETDGGAVEFVSFNDGVVSLLLQGSCSGCPSASFTLKAGIEMLLKRMVPEVTEVVAVAG